ncbi:MAG: hypothetical protein II561_07280, partial [Thermoguttaceae bacterium]|nr:hypothetical protein [Thermoguttaceae bacterium]
MRQLEIRGLWKEWIRVVMFLLYLSDRNYESRYLAFILRLETIVAGVVTEMAKRIETLTDR